MGDVFGIDLGTNPTTDFKNNKTDMYDTASPHIPQILVLEEEGLQDDKSHNQNYPQMIPEYILPTHQRPTHHKPDLIRAIGYITSLEGQLVPDLTFRGRRQLQIIECKYSPDGNTQAVIDHIY
jgi:hypothetical protein